MKVNPHIGSNFDDFLKEEGIKDKLWDIISNPHTIKIDGVKVPAWTIPDLKDRKAMVEAIVKVIPLTIPLDKDEQKEILAWIKESYVVADGNKGMTNGK